MRRVAGFTITAIAALGLLADPLGACDGSHNEGDWACVYSMEANVGHCVQNPIPTVDAPEETEVLPEVPDVAPLVEEYVVPLLPKKL